MTKLKYFLDAITDNPIYKIYILERDLCNYDDCNVILSHKSKKEVLESDLFTIVSNSLVRDIDVSSSMIIIDVLRDENTVKAAAIAKERY